MGFAGFFPLKNFLNTVRDLPCPRDVIRTVFHFYKGNKHLCQLASGSFVFC